jgi:triacylglycerol lipase
MVPNMGPINSNWDRACEVYAQLAGTVVDYGVARSLKLGHKRFGRDHTGRAMYPEILKNPNARINMIGHSMGSPTARGLAYLLAKGSQEEMDAAAKARVQASPLFWTNRTFNPTIGIFSIT